MADEPSGEVRAQALAAGLGAALDAFPGDVAAAAASARTAAGALRLPADPLAEPWPPMRTGLPA